MMTHDVQPTFIDTWGRWILGGLLTTIIALILVQWKSLDNRMTAVETWRDKHMEIETVQMTQLATVVARQEQVLRRLDENSAKLDELLKLYYQLQGSSKVK